MTIILRLQGLDVNASTEDIRAFFECLHIPDGGVYIVGGRLGEAFIAFASERDGQLAMRRTGTFLKGSMVTLHVSSVEELEQKLKSLLKRKKSSPGQLTVKKARTSPDPNQPQPHTSISANLPPTSAQTLDPSPANLPQPLCPDTPNLKTFDANSMDSKTAFLLGICTVLQGLQSTHQRENNTAVETVDFPNTESAVLYDEGRTPEDTPNSKPGYVRLFGLPASTTKKDICHFFKGLKVLEAIVNVKLGIGYGCLVKFASAQEACDALLLNQQSLGPICVEVRGATEKMWTSALEECENASDVGEGMKSKPSPLKETANYIQNPTSAPWDRERFRNHQPSKSAKKPRIDSDPNTALSTIEYTVMVSNLPKTMTKTEIKELFGCPNIAHRNVLHLLDMDGNRTDTAFVIFNCFEDYEYAMNLRGCHVGSNSIEVSSISKTMMRELMAKNHPRNHKQVTNKKSLGNGKFDPTETEEEQDVTLDPAAQRHVFVRNLPADVQKNQIKSLFHGFRLKKGNIILLCDSDGKGIGEAVVQFKSENLASLAQKLHGTDFQGTKILLTPINGKQMEDILARNV